MQKGTLFAILTVVLVAGVPAAAYATQGDPLANVNCATEGDPLSNINCAAVEGAVKWFSDTKGYGVIIGGAGDDTVESERGTVPTEGDTGVQGGRGRNPQTGGTIQIPAKKVVKFKAGKDLSEVDSFFDVWTEVNPADGDTDGDTDGDRFGDAVVTEIVSLDLTGGPFPVHVRLSDDASEALKKGGRVALVGFGSFSVSTHGARTGRNPQTGGTIQIPAKKVVKFKAGKDLSETVR